ncbi:MAG: branched-chain amino acid ABC transporter permease [candidate division SR1 bacterium]|nr:branched-chain amino acid ABC transporter permease [candidate division SR1 bacterium]
MFSNFILHIIITAIIFTVIASGFKFFIKLKGGLDFSYIAIIMFASYIGALININLGIGILGCIGISFLAAIPFTFLILFLSSKLNDVYFTIGTFALYMLVYQLAYNLEGVTGGALGLSGISRNLIGGIVLQSLWQFFIFGAIVIGIVVGFLIYFKRTYIYKILTGRGENLLSVKSLGTSINKYKTGMILVTTALAVIGGNLFSFYYLYIDPSSFWIGMLELALVIVFVSYKWNDGGTLIVGLLVTFFYEYLRFFKIVDPSRLGYFREMLFGAMIVIVSFIVFRKTKFGRDV